MTLTTSLLVSECIWSMLGVNGQKERSGFIVSSRWPRSSSAPILAVVKETTVENALKNSRILWPGGFANRYFCFFGGSFSLLSSFLCGTLSSCHRSLCLVVPLYHHYFSFPSFCLLVICSAWRFQGGCCRRTYPRDSLEWAMLVVDYSQCRCHMASALCRTASDSMERSPLYSVRSNISFYSRTYPGLFLRFLFPPACIYHTPNTAWHPRHVYISIFQLFISPISISTHLYL